MEASRERRQCKSMSSLKKCPASWPRPRTGWKTGGMWRGIDDELTKGENGGGGPTPVDRGVTAAVADGLRVRRVEAGMMSVVAGRASL